MSLPSSLRTFSKVALVAGFIGATGMVAMPAQAAPTSSGSITFSFGSSTPYHFSNGRFANNYCLTSSEIRSALRAKGFRKVQIIRDFGRHRVLAVGYKNSHWYQLLVDPCTGYVEQRRVYRRSDGGFSFTLSFGGYGNGGFDDHGGYGGDDHHGYPGDDHGGYGGGPGPHEELVCLVTFFDESQVSAGADANVESARVLPRSVAESLDRPNDRRRIFDYGTDAQTRATCDHLDQLNN
jgi:hypothetical protein